MFWNRKKEKDQNHEYWRDKNGKIVCPGEYACSQKCSERCPIKCNTDGLELSMNNRLGAAIQKFQQAISIAPDFPDAYNNLGAAYGMNNQDQEAYECYKKALELRKLYPNALNGIIIAERNLGLYDDALKHCDDLERLHPQRASELRRNIKAKMNASPAAPAINWLSLGGELIDKARHDGYVKSENCPQIPELMVQADTVCSQIMRDQIIAENDGDSDINSRIITVSAWSALAGMGAVYHWHVDWDALQRAGIYKTLTKERGYVAMDEYVFATIGIPFGSDECKKLTSYMFTLTVYALQKLTEAGVQPSTSTLTIIQKAMYAFGMVFEMNRLGML